MLRINGNGDVVVGVQQVRPPVLLEYDKDTNLKNVYLENTSRQFDRTHSKGTLAYVDRCTAFEDGSADGHWCALVVDRHQSMKLYRDPDLTRGIAVDAPLEATQQGPRPRVRQPIMLTQAARKTDAGRYMLELYAKRRPTRAFWVEAVSSERKVVLAQQWVVPTPPGASACRWAWNMRWKTWRFVPGLITPKTSAWTTWPWSRTSRWRIAPDVPTCVHRWSGMVVQSAQADRLAAAQPSPTSPAQSSDAGAPSPASRATAAPARLKRISCGDCNAMPTVAMRCSSAKNSWLRTPYESRGLLT